MDSARHTAPSDDVAQLRQELWIARDAAIGAEAEAAVLAGRVAELEARNDALSAEAEELGRMLPALHKLRDSRVWRHTGGVRQRVLNRNRS